MKSTDLNADLATATIVTRLEFSTDLATGECSLIIELVNDDRAPTAKVVVEAGGISQWSVQNFGGGVTQLLCLRASDVAELQHDRTRFFLDDLENRAFFLKCKTLTTRRPTLLRDCD